MKRVVLECCVGASAFRSRRGASSELLRLVPEQRHVTGLAAFVEPVEVPYLWRPQLTDPDDEMVHEQRHPPSQVAGVHRSGGRVLQATSRRCASRDVARAASARARPRPRSGRRVARGLGALSRHAGHRTAGVAHRLGAVAVVVPCFRVRRHVLGVLDGLRGRVGRVYVVDDACPEGTGRFVEGLGRADVTVLWHARNQGVGGAVLTGYARALADGFRIVVKMDGDGQMDPAYLDALVAPVLAGVADYAKGDRFCGWRSVRAMPWERVVGNLVASLAMRAAARWRGMDPCNGYTAVSRETLLALPFGRMERRWFFECDMLCWLGARGARVRDVPIPARYGDEASGLNTWRVLQAFPGRMAGRMAGRMLRRRWS